MQTENPATPNATPTRDKILSDLYTSKDLAALINKMQPADLRDDIRQELFVILCEQPYDKIIALHESKQLKFFTVRIVLNMVASKNSRFFYKFRKVKIDTVEFKEISNLLSVNDADESFLVNDNLIGLKDYIKGKTEAIDTSYTALEFEADYQRLVENTNLAIDSLHWYMKEVLQQYFFYGSAGKMVDAMKERLGGKYIPKRSILDTVKKAKQEIKAKVIELNKKDAA